MQNQDESGAVRQEQDDGHRLGNGARGKGLPRQVGTPQRYGKGKLRKVTSPAGLRDIQSRGLGLRPEVRTPSRAQTSSIGYRAQSSRPRKRAQSSRAQRAIGERRIESRNSTKRANSSSKITRAKSSHGLIPIEKRQLMARQPESLTFEAPVASKRPRTGGIVNPNFTAGFLKTESYFHRMIQTAQDATWAKGWLDNSSFERPETTPAPLIQRIPRRPKTALDPLPLPELDTSLGAVRGWLFRQGKYAHNVIGDEGLKSSLQWKEFYYVSDPGSRSLVELQDPSQEVASQVFKLAGSVVSTQGWKCIGPHNIRVYTFQVDAPTGIPGRRQVVLLGCLDELFALRWVQVIRECREGYRKNVKNKKIARFQEYKSLAYQENTSVFEEATPVDKVNKLSTDLTVFDGVSIKEELEKQGLLLGIAYGHRKGNERGEKTTPIPGWRIISVETQAAEKIQSQIRMFIARMLVFDDKGMLDRARAAVRIQATFRRLQALWKLNLMRQRHNASIQIQCSWRCFVACRNVGALRLQTNSASTIQRAWRCSVARSILTERQMEKKQALEELMADVLSEIERDYQLFLEQEEKRLRICSSLIIQCAYRQYLARCKLHMLQLEHHRRFQGICASKVQAQARGHLERKRYALKRFGVGKLQAWFRGYRGRQKAKRKRWQIFNITIIQTWARCLLQRREWKRKQNASYYINRFARMILACKARIAAMRVRYVRTQSAIVIQSFARMWKSQGLVFAQPHGLLHQWRACTKIQAVERGRVARRWYENTRVAVIIIQRFSRQMAARSLVRLMQLERRDRMTRKIQKFYRNCILWRSMMNATERRANEFIKCGRIYHGAYLYNHNIYIASVDIISTSADMLVRISCVGVETREVQVGSWFLVQFINIVIEQKSLSIRSLAEALARFLTMYKDESDCEFMFQKKLSLPRAFSHVDRERASNSFFQKLWQEVKVIEDSMHDSAKDKVINCIEEFEDKFHMSEYDQRAKQGFRILEQVGSISSDFSYAHALLQLEAPELGMFARMKTTRMKKLKVECCLKVDESTVPNVIKRFSNKAVSGYLPKGTQPLGALKGKFQSSLNPQYFFNFDLNAFNQGLESRVEMIDNLWKAEDLVLEALVDKKIRRLIEKPIARLQETLAETSRKRTDLIEDINRWKSDIKEREEKLAAEDFDQEDQDTVKMLQHEIQYMELKRDLSRRVMKTFINTIEQCTDDLPYLEECKAKLYKARTEIRFLIDNGRTLRSECIKHETLALKRAIPVIDKCSSTMGLLVGGFFSHNRKVLETCDYFLGRYFGPLSERMRELKQFHRKSVEQLKWQQGALAKLSSALLGFTEKTADRVENSEYDVKDCIEAELEALKESSALILQAETELVEHRGSYDRKKAAEAQLVEIIREDEEALKEYEKDLVANRAIPHTEELDEVWEIINADSNVILARTEKLSQVVDRLATTDEISGFEAKQIFSALRKCKRAIYLLERRELDKAKTEFVNVSERIKPGIGFIRELQGRFEKLEEVEKSSVNESESQSDSDSGSEYSYDSEDSNDDVKINMVMFASKTASLATNTAILCSDYCDILQEMREEEEDIPAKYLPEAAQVKEEEEDEVEKIKKAREKQQEKNKLPGVVRKGVVRVLGPAKTDALAKNPVVKLAAATGGFPRAISNRTYKFVERRYIVFGANRIKLQRVWAARAKVAFEKAKDPFGWQQYQIEQAATTIQRTYRGYACRKRLRTYAALTIQCMYRQRVAWFVYKKTLHERTVKHYDSLSGKYYYTWPTRISWEPPPALEGMYIMFGERKKRATGHEWTDEEAALLVQTTFRARKARREFIDHVKNSYEKLWEPSKHCYFYQNVVSGKCQWQKPVGLGLDDIEASTYPVWDEDTGEYFVETNPNVNKRLDYNYF